MILTSLFTRRRPFFLPYSGRKNHTRVNHQIYRKTRNMSVGRTRNRAITKAAALSSDFIPDDVLRIPDRIDTSDMVDFLVGSGLPDRRRIPNEFSKLRAQASVQPPIKASPIPRNAFNTDVLGVGAHVVTSDRQSDKLDYRVPASVLTCVRRSQRRQVLFATGRTGSGHKKPRWTSQSYMRC